MDLNLDVLATDRRCIEVVINGLPVWGEARMLPQTRRSSALLGATARPDQAKTQSGSASPLPAHIDAFRVGLDAAGLSCSAEVGSRFSHSTLTFLRLAARASRGPRASHVVCCWTTLASLAALLRTPARC